MSGNFSSLVVLDSTILMLIHVVGYQRDHGMRYVDWMSCQGMVLKQANAKIIAMITNVFRLFIDL